MNKIAFLGVIVLLTGAHAEDRNVSRINFPIVVEQPSGSSAVASGGIAFRQTFRSEKAVRLTAPLSISYLSPGDKNEQKIELQTNTVFILARDQAGDLFCAANSSEVGFLVSMLAGPLITPFKDYGICIRDSNGDGTIDSALVVDQKPYRTRTPYEIIGTGKSEWKPVTVMVEPVAASDIPLADLRVTYDYISGGLMGKRHGLLHFMVCWPPSLVSAAASDDVNKGCASLPLGMRGDGIEIGAGDGGRTEFRGAPFIFESVIDKDDRLTLTIKQGVMAGPAKLYVVGRLWRPKSPLYQRSVVDIHQDGAPPVDVVLPPALKALLEGAAK